MDWEKYDKALRTNKIASNFQDVSTEDMEEAARRFLNFSIHRKENAVLTLTARNFEEFQLLEPYGMQMKTWRGKDVEIRVLRARYGVEVQFDNIDWKELS